MWSFQREMMKMHKKKRPNKRRRDKARTRDLAVKTGMKYQEARRLCIRARSAHREHEETERRMEPLTPPAVKSTFATQANPAAGPAELSKSMATLFAEQRAFAALTKVAGLAERIKPVATLGTAFAEQREFAALTKPVAVVESMFAKVAGLAAVESTFVKAAGLAERTKPVATLGTMFAESREFAALAKPVTAVESMFKPVTTLGTMFAELTKPIERMLAWSR